MSANFKFLVGTALSLIVLNITALASSKETRLSAAGSGSTITLTKSGQCHRIHLPDEVRVDMDDAVLLANKNRKDFQYILLFVTGPSRRGGNHMGRCGAGIESSIVWLKLRNWQIADSKHRLVESCWHGQSLLKPVQWIHEVCCAVFWDPNDENSTVTLRYDSRKPQKGFSFTKEPFNK